MGSWGRPPTLTRSLEKSAAAGAVLEEYIDQKRLSLRAQRELRASVRGAPCRGMLPLRKRFCVVLATDTCISLLVICILL